LHGRECDDTNLDISSVDGQQMGYLSSNGVRRDGVVTGHHDDFDLADLRNQQYGKKKKTTNQPTITSNNKPKPKPNTKRNTIRNQN
jgi:hypothetical protein